MMKDWVDLLPEQARKQKVLMSDWLSVGDEEITCNAKYGKDGDYDGLDDEGEELLQRLLVRLPHLLRSGLCQINPGCSNLWKCGQQIQWQPNCFYASSSSSHPPQSGVMNYWVSIQWTST